MRSVSCITLCCALTVGSFYKEKSSTTHTFSPGSCEPPAAWSLLPGPGSPRSSGRCTPGVCRRTGQPCRHREGERWRGTHQHSTERSSSCTSIWSEWVVFSHGLNGTRKAVLRSAVWILQTSAQSQVKAGLARKKGHNSRSNRTHQQEKCKKEF